ncbi:hypothetical protein FHS29_000769 [Saccharothrix tamanrassetensis]|uniref:Uncharacterized protein n=1 Tax=Saccharothrix tamanrassetensis TaxID=1051531 RepID=A0A841C9W5_9PSEU|nr:hypothetical protein [Saccharothrix tamanrassetensis]MBB5954199.1 hypothetical protein [Saccharothrix tamanrassetensis]
MKPVWLPLVLVGLLGTLWEYGAFAGIAALLVVAGWWRSPRLACAAVAFGVAAFVGAQPFPAVVAVLAALLLAAHDLHARRPGVWFPLLATGLGVFAVTLSDEWPAGWDEDRFDHGLSYTDLSGVTMSRAYESSISIAFDVGGSWYAGGDWYATVAMAVVVSLGLVIWAWRARSPTVALTAAAYLAAAWYLTPPAAPSPGLQFLSQEQFRTVHVAEPAGIGHPELVILAGAAVAFAVGARPAGRRATDA